MAGNKKLAHNFPSINPIETAKDFGSAAMDSFKKDIIHDIGKPVVDDFFAQLFGTETPAEKTKSAKSGELKPGQSLDLKGMRAASSHEKQKNHNILPGIDYRSEIVHGRERSIKRENQEITRMVEDIKVELQKLLAATKELQKEAAKEPLLASPANAGKYHVNFFEWLLITIRQARAQVEDGSAWMHAMSSKGQKKGGNYWNMFKKHGTTFGMSHERNVATQTG
jgi:hypothetical protein